MRFGGIADEGPAHNGQYLLRIFGVTNIALGIFNLIPVPPLDGSTVLGNFVPAYRPVRRYKIAEHGRAIEWRHGYEVENAQSDISDSEDAQQILAVMSRAFVSNTAKAHPNREGPRGLDALWRYC